MQKKEPKVLARELAERKKVDVYLDKLFIRQLVKEAQKISPDIGALVYTNTKLLVFLYRNIIIYNVQMDEYNLNEISIPRHAEQIRKIVKMIDLGMLKLRKINPFSMKNNKGSGKILY
ncbi:MAG: hypothetical protein KGJ90_06560 [Patescibacteria group bacterium]|nr:hypothetical protein [Patescibacteria group bacterium]